METVTSADGTVIAYDRIGEGSAGTVIVVGGALSFRKFPKMVRLAERLAADHGLTVLNYDRRGRGDSGDTPGVYDVRSEIDDIGALIEAAGGSAALLGWSSGAVLALQAAGSERAPGVTKVVAFEPPYVVDKSGHVPPKDADAKLRALVAAGKRGKAVSYYLRKIMGVPWTMVSAMRITPYWKTLKGLADSTPHDWTVLSPFARGEKLRGVEWAHADVPVLVLSGAQSAATLKTAAKAIAAVLPDAEHRELDKLGHDPNVDLIAAPAGEFLTR
ncbi:alpha/beta hydrolase [Nocardia puris]|uniref:alpha/beta fold hydrolase n=1 Tax=Nocardia puris TaxID=208602 RepID=UPI001895066F|nr:alpha/beta hydrolase [Nocardia puris]MBF6211116.1 alpha/beta hydrolase [Nocardia puris]MBF6364835.1 alpha/beta hydrolase [Nocardia puris]MBF6458621.1 alpha/beta hydrolase [Nocardia puris]